MAVEFRGSEYLYLVKIPDETNRPFRIFNQTDGSTDVDAGEIELDTKDKSGADYGKITQTISVDGILTEGDKAIKYIKKAQRDKKFIYVVEVNTRTGDTEEGYYMITSFNRASSNGDYATYSLGATLNGALIEGTLEDVPDGAPDEGIEAPEEPEV